MPERRQGGETGVHQQLIELIHVLRRIALARRVALDSTRMGGSNKVESPTCSTQQVVDLLLLAKSIASQAMKLTSSARHDVSRNLFDQDRGPIHRFDCKAKLN
jgi:hypothetical protein